MRKQGKSVGKICEICGKAFQVTASVAKHGGGRCCSIACRAVMGGRERQRQVDQSGANNPSYIDGQCHSVERRRKYQRALRGKHPERAAIYARVDRAIADGTLIRQPCETCGADGRIEAHHDDYDKPLSVRWFCHQCHADYHKTERKKSC